MGVPKFFRWIGERYPVCSQLVGENNVPEFDNLYLDMNGIIHACSHPNDSDVHFRLTEEQIFVSIFNYIDHLFAKIKPQKLFYMAVDGVAPRAKMNQQRSRRFRTAKEAQDAHRSAMAKGIELPAEPPFDSNCITPGTEFMAKLSAQLKYFVNKKVTEDKAWQGLDIVLSGHEVPGEGEHKIMEYLRLAKSGPTYDQNVRHCLYGLDADLIMLGLLSHEPHFCLLREEVTFGRTSKKTLASANPDSQSFYLMHLSLLREYLELEFLPLKDSLPFEYDFERILDDFILMSFFVGNDFLPSLPGLHINQGALSFMFEEYKSVLPIMGGYLNNGGKLHLPRCQALLRKLGELEKTNFKEEAGDLKWLETKTGGKGHVKKISLEMSPTQKKYYMQIKRFIQDNEKDCPPLIFNISNMSAADKEFICKAAGDVGLDHGFSNTSGSKKKNQIFVTWFEDEESDEEGEIARNRIIKRYDQAIIVDEHSSRANSETSAERAFEAQFGNWKDDYYKSKMNIDAKDHESRKSLVNTYIEGLQWVLLYYYEGVPSWEWFFPFHYAPMITDLTGFETLEIVFEEGSPFRPFDQLMGVLPAGSKQHIPPAFRDLMTDPGSPIVDFYPEDFELDMNGKKASWEAIVLIPFIDEQRLLATLNARSKMLTGEENARNTFGTSFLFRYTASGTRNYPSSLPGMFPDINSCKCEMKPWQNPTIGKNGLVKGLCAGARLKIDSLPGFPSLYTISHTAALGYHGVSVFNSESQNESMILTLTNIYEGLSPENVVRRLGPTVYFGYPFFNEALVVCVSDAFFSYQLTAVDVDGKKRLDVVKVEHSRYRAEKYCRSAEAGEIFYSKKYGIILGPVDLVVTLLPFKGMKLLDDGSLIKEYVTRDGEIDVPLMTVLESVRNEDPRRKERPARPVSLDFPLKSQVFLLSSHPDNHGAYSEVTGHHGHTLNIRFLKCIDQEFSLELNRVREIALKGEKTDNYCPSYLVAKKLKLHSLVLAKVTSSLTVSCKITNRSYNLGLQLKFESKQKKVLGFTRKGERGWEYSDTARELLAQYMDSFPEFFSGLNRHPDKNVYEDTDFWSPSESQSKLAEMAKWCVENGVKGHDKVNLETEALSKEWAFKIQSYVDNVYSKFESAKLKAISVTKVPRRAVLKAEHAKYRLQTQDFALGDRVIHVSDTGSCPIGVKGTVIGIEGRFLEVIFDKALLSASSLAGRCGDNRGMYLDRETMLNLTNPQPPVEQSSLSLPDLSLERDKMSSNSRPNSSSSRRGRGTRNTNGNASPFGQRSTGRMQPASPPSENKWSAKPNINPSQPSQSSRKGKNTSSGRSRQGMTAPNGASVDDTRSAHPMANSGEVDEITANLKSMLNIGDTQGDTRYMTGLATVQSKEGITDRSQISERLMQGFTKNNLDSNSSNPRKPQVETRNELHDLMQTANGSPRGRGRGRGRRGYRGGRGNRGRGSTAS